MKIRFLLLVLAFYLGLASSFANRCFVTISPCFAENPELSNLLPDVTDVPLAPSCGMFNGTSYEAAVMDCNLSCFDPNVLVPDVTTAADSCIFDGFVVVSCIPNTTVCQRDTIIVLLSTNFCATAVDDNAYVPSGGSVDISPIDNDLFYVGFPPEDSCELDVMVFPTNGIVTPLPMCDGFEYTPNPGFMGFDTLNYQVCIASFCTSADIIVNVNVNIPTLSEWGMIILTLLLLAFGARKLV